ncbi:putative Cytochrome c [Candidatus Zixiibacteriota bacterium]|nr:putative Cytochrome c [candidate division Zixibacteria bacterium]
MYFLFVLKKIMNPPILHFRPNRYWSIIVILLAVILVSGNGAFGFHSGGVATCSSCHTLHNSQEGMPVDPNDISGNQWLLITSSASDLCLSCHGEQNGAVFGTNPLTPPPEKGAGNFVFLLEDNINDAPDGAINPINGDAAGHNINAPSRGVAADRTLITAPGGTFPASEMGCTSCHNPHGNNSFRYLNGVGTVQGGAATFAFPAPNAVGIDINGDPESNSHHTAYLNGMTQWCCNCHTGYIDGHQGTFSHPTDRPLSGRIVQQYDIYNGTADSVGGVAATAYLAEVPFEDGTNTTSSTAGPYPSSQLMCLSCHRAHASSAPYAGRWDFNVDLLSQDGVVSGSYPIPNPYISPTQKSLCYKCHPSGSG